MFSTFNVRNSVLVYNELSDLRKELLTDTQMEVESGIEALEDNLDGFCEINESDQPLFDGKPSDKDPSKRKDGHVTFGSPPSKNNMMDKKLTSKRNHFCSFTMYFLTFLIFISFILFPNSNVWNGFVLGLWFFCFTSTLKSWLLDTFFTEFEQSKPSMIQLKRSSAMPVSYTIPSVKEHTPIKKYEVSHNSFYSFLYPTSGQRSFLLSSTCRETAPVLKEPIHFVPPSAISVVCSLPHFLWAPDL